MGSLEHRFRSFSKDPDNQGHSTLIYFIRTIQGQPLSKDRVAFYFRKLVEKGDYAKVDQKEILVWLNSQTAHAGIRVFKEKNTRNRTKVPQKKGVLSPYRLFA